ncbi:hypothetical protein M422DRAFT_155324 [Sphaerobolus stellatus SS14]|nr:hypothetical protein M422DRAFT_155324 [Sphaerobolus stellatus SS14]
MPPRPNEDVLNHGRGILVTTHGPGQLHIYTYFAMPPGRPLIHGGPVGFLQTQSQGISRFIIGKSYDYTHFAFFWNGKGHAEYSVGDLPQKHPVGRSWATSSFWNTSYWYILPVEVTQAYFAGAVNNKQHITIYRIPEDFLEEEREEEREE